MARFVVLDTETTGVDAKLDKIVEIALIEIVNGVIGESYQTYLNPGIPCSPEAFKIHQIPDSVLAASPTFKEKHEEIYNFIKGDSIVGHFAHFDLGFLLTESEAINEPLLAAHFHTMLVINDFFCTRNLAKQLWPSMSCKLPNVCAKLEIDFDVNQAHGAIYDATKAAEVFCKLAPLYKIDL